MYRHPWLARLDRDAYKHTGIVIVVAHFIHHPNSAIPHLAARPVQQSHSAMRANQSIFNSHAARPDMLPAAQIFAIKQWLESLPFLGRAFFFSLTFFLRTSSREE